MWYGIKTLYRSDTSPGPPSEAPVSALEQRVVLFEADSAERAIELGEAEAVEYAAGTTWVNDAGQVITCRFLEVLESYRFDEQPASGIEVFSKILFVPRDQGDSELVTRLLGSKDEEGLEVRGSFEPNIESILSAVDDHDHKG